MTGRQRSLVVLRATNQPKSGMVRVRVGDGLAGTDVEFPFPPYPSQVAYMAHVVAALEHQTNALLESPTGTGKTLCLLCSLLGWLQRRKGESVGMPGAAPGSPRRVLYVTRTHAQLAQVIREFRRTVYAQTCRMAVLGSRDHLCVHPEVRVMSGSAATAMCNHLRGERRCRFALGVPGAVANASRDCSSAGVSSRSVEGTQAIGGGGCAMTNVDIEDMVTAGRSQGFCPYFFERELAATADIIFAPYSYVLDATVRRATATSTKSSSNPADGMPMGAAAAASSPVPPLEGTVVVIDEAHNVPSFMTSNATITLTSIDVARCFDETRRGITFLKDQAEQEAKANRDNQFNVDASVAADAVRLAEEFVEFMGFLSRFESSIATLDIPSGKREFDTEPTAFVDLIAKSQGDVPSLMPTIDRIVMALSKTESASRSLPTLQKMLSLIAHRDGTAKRSFDGQPTSSTHAFLRRALDEAQRADLRGEEDSSASFDETYRFVVIAEGDAPRYADSLAAPRNALRRSIGLWCLDTAVATRDVLRPYSMVIMTSGTLSPMQHFAAETGLRFGVTLQGAHVIDSSTQLFAAVACRSPEGQLLSSAFVARHTDVYRRCLGGLIVNVCRQVPNGVIVCFPSYLAMQDAVEFWQTAPASGIDPTVAGKATLWADLMNVKRIFIEPRDSKELPEVIRLFQQAADDESGPGAVLMAISRGKVTEGIDFADRHGRCIIVTGVPYANATDFFVRLKKEFLTKVAPRRPRVDGKPFTGDEWYRNEAMRAVNQCIGRVIRHKDDYGAIVLADERFAGLVSALSSWVRKAVVVYEQFGPVYQGIGKFFAGRVTAPVVRPITRRTSPASGPFVAETAMRPANADDAEAFELRRIEQQKARAESDRQSEFQPHGLEERGLPTVEVSRLGLVPPSASSPSAGLPESVGSNSLPNDVTTLKPLCVASSHVPVSTVAASRSAAAFVEVLKAHLSAAAYTEFKECLKALNGLKGVHKRPATSPELAQFSAWVHRLADCFATVEASPVALRSGERASRWLDEFASFLPAENRPIYAQALRKRPRT